MKTTYKQTEQKVLLSIALIGLFGMLAYTFVHTGAVLGRYVRPVWVGYLAAFGIELIVAGMSYRLATLRRIRENHKGLVLTLSLALLVSMFANIAEGYFVRYGEHIRIDTLGQVDPIQAFVGVSATGLISILVFAISEIIGADMNTVARGAEQKRRQEKQEGEQPEPVDPNGPNDYKTAIWAIMDGGERLGPTAMADRVGCVKSTASDYIKQYEPNGVGK